MFWWGRRMMTTGEPSGAAYVILGSSLGTNSTIDLWYADYKLVGEATV